MMAANLALVPTAGIVLARAEGAVSVSDFQSVLTAMQGQVSVASVVGVLAAGATAAVGFAFMWWGVRKLTQMLFSGSKSGRVNV